MSRKSRRDFRKQRGNTEEIHFFDEIPHSSIDAEKNKARKLRHSAWWKRKIATGVCHYCKDHFKPEELTMDHVIPIARGGRSEKINLVPCCKECNSKKKYMLPVEWEEYLQKRVSEN